MLKFMNFDPEKNFWPRVGEGKILKSIKTTWSIWCLDLLKIIISNSLYLRLRGFSCRDFLWKEKTTFWEQKLSKTTKLFETFMFLSIRCITQHSAQTIKSLSLFYLFSNLSVLMDFCSDLNWACWQLLEFAPVRSTSVLSSQSLHFASTFIILRTLPAM